MDGKRFDDLTRGFSNRRGLLKGLGGAIAAAVGLGATGGRVDAACRPGGYSCQRDTDCCSAKCYYASATDRARVCCTPTQTNAQICAGKVCGTYTNSCGQTVTCGTCNGNDENPCTGPVTCSAAGQCVFPPLANGTDCGTDSDCRTCQNGTCTFLCTTEQTCCNNTCKFANGHTCTADSQCCDGFCADGVCCRTACTGPCQTCNGSTQTKGQCTNFSDGTAAEGLPGQICCDGDPCFGECIDGSCSCAEETDYCDDNRDCCSPMSCVGGQCCSTDNTNQCCLSPKQLCKGGVCCEGFCDGNGECCPSPPNLDHGCNGGTCCAGDCDIHGDCCPTNDGVHHFCGSGNCCTTPGCADNGSCNPECEPDTCDGDYYFGYACGAVPDNCGGTNDPACICAAGQTCNYSQGTWGFCQVNNGGACPDGQNSTCLGGYCCNNICQSTPCCTPLTCSYYAGTTQCGSSLPNGCGSPISCGCPTGQTCNNATNGFCVLSIGSACSGTNPNYTCANPYLCSGGICVNCIPQGNSCVGATGNCCAGSTCQAGTCLSG